MHQRRFWQLPSLSGYQRVGVFNRDWLILDREYLLSLEKYYRGADYLRSIPFDIESWSEFDPLLCSDNTIYQVNNNDYRPLKIINPGKVQFWPNQLITSFRDKTLSVYQVRDQEVVALFAYTHLNRQIALLYNIGINSASNVIAVYQAHHYNTQDQEDVKSYFIHRFNNKSYTAKLDEYDTYGEGIDFHSQYNSYTPDGCYYLEGLSSQVWDLELRILRTFNNDQIPYDFNDRGQLLSYYNNYDTRQTPSVLKPMKFSKDREILELPLSLTGNVQSSNLSTREVSNRYSNTLLKYTRDVESVKIVYPSNFTSVADIYNGVLQPQDVLYIDYSKMQAHILKDFRYAVDARIYVLKDKFLVLWFIDRIEIWVLDIFRWEATSLYIDALGSRIGDTLLSMQKENLWLPQELKDKVVRDIIEQDG